jgi:hypothetical protein
MTVSALKKEDLKRAFKLGDDTMPRACAICGLSGADHVTPKGEPIHLKCGQQLWRRQLDSAKRRGAA